MSNIINKVVEIGSFGLIDDITGVEAGEKAAREAAGLQADASTAGTEEIRRQFDITQENLQPFTQTGADALNQQRILLGLGALAPEQLPTQAPLQTAAGSAFGQLNKATGGAFGDFSLPSKSGQQPLQLGQRDQFGNVGGSTVNRNEVANQQAIAAQGTAAEQQQAAFAAFNESPGQKFLRDRAQKNLVRNASAIGGLGGGNVRSALVEQGVGFAQQDFQNQFSRLGQLAGQGQAATTNVGQFGQQASQGIAQGIQNTAQARASGLLGAQQVGAQFNQGLLGAAGTIFGGLAGGGFFG